MTVACMEVVQQIWGERKSEEAGKNLQKNISQVNLVDTKINLSIIPKVCAYFQK